MPTCVLRRLEMTPEPNRLTEENRYTMSNGYRLLVFDWDGTLMDSEARIVACVQAAATDLELTVPSDAEARNIIGLGLREAVTTLFPGADDDLIARMVAQYRHHFLHVNQTPSQLFANADRVVRALAEQDYLLAVATGKGRQGLDQVLVDTGFAQLFHATRCADETRSKPHPEMLLQILDELGMEADQALMIGDTEYDMQMAANAGVDGLAVSYGVHDVERLSRYASRGFIHDIGELPDWLDERV